MPFGLGIRIKGKRIAIPRWVAHAGFVGCGKRNLPVRSDDGFCLDAEFQEAQRCLESARIPKLRVLMHEVGVFAIDDCGKNDVAAIGGEGFFGDTSHVDSSIINGCADIER